MKDGRRWLNLPNKEYKDKDGETKYQPIIRFRDKDHYNKFCEIAKEAVDVWCAEHPLEIAAEGQVIIANGIPF